MTTTDDKPPTTFREVWPRTPDRDDALVRLVDKSWWLHLGRLYLYSGRTMDSQAKRLGVLFGFCDERGVKFAGRPRDVTADGHRFVVDVDATHVGWTVEMGPAVREVFLDVVQRAIELGYPEVAELLRTETNPASESDCLLAIEAGAWERTNTRSPPDRQPAPKESAEQSAALAKCYQLGVHVYDRGLLRRDPGRWYIATPYTHSRA